MKECFYCKEIKETIRTSKPENDKKVEEFNLQIDFVIRAGMIDVCQDCWEKHLALCGIAPIIISSWTVAKRFVEFAQEKRTIKLESD